MQPFICSRLCYAIFVFSIRISVSSVMFRFFFTALVCFQCNRDVLAAHTGDELSIVSARMSPPQNPHPEVAAEIALLEKASTSMETQLDALLKQAYDKTLKDAEESINAIIGEGSRKHAHLRSSISEKSRSALKRSVSLVEQHQEAFSIRLKVMGGTPASTEIVPMMEQLEKRRARTLKAIFKRTMREFAGLTEIVKHELQSRLAGVSEIALPGTAFATVQEHYEKKLGGSSMPVQVRVGVSDKKWPSVSDLIVDLERRRDIRENRYHVQIIDMELRLLQKENQMMQNALNRLRNNL